MTSGRERIIAPRPDLGTRPSGPPPRRTNVSHATGSRFEHELGAIGVCDGEAPGDDVADDRGPGGRAEGDEDVPRRDGARQLPVAGGRREVGREDAGQERAGGDAAAELADQQRLLDEAVADPA